MLKKIVRKVAPWAVMALIIGVVIAYAEHRLNIVQEYEDGGAAWTISKDSDGFKVKVQMPNPAWSEPTFTATKKVKTVVEAELFARNMANANMVSSGGTNLAERYLEPEMDKPWVYDGPPGRPIMNLNTGTHTTLYVQAYGKKPFTYKWRRNGVVVSEVLDNSNFNITAGPGISGLYDCIVSNPTGADTSKVVSVVVQ